MCFKQISGGGGGGWGEGKYTIPRFFSTFNYDQGPVVRRPISASKVVSRIISFLCYFQSIQSSTYRQKELKLKCFLSFQI